MGSMFSHIGTETWILIGIAVIIALYLWFLERKGKRVDRIDALCETYRVLTAETLNALPDDEAVKAVVANLTAKEDKNHPDLLFTLSQLSAGRQAVYGWWILCHEAQRSPAAVFANRNRRVREFALDGCEVLGLSVCRDALTSTDTDRETQLCAAIENERPLEACLRLIRDDPDSFVD